MPTGKLPVIFAMAFDVVAKRENVAALAHGDGKADRRLAIHAELWLRRIDIAAVNARDVAEAKHAAADGKVDAGDVLFGAERRLKLSPRRIPCPSE